MSLLPEFSWPVPSSNRGSDFASQDDVMSHLEGEASGWYMLGSNGLWHGGIHITNATTPWCALSGKAPSEAVDFPVAFKGEQSVRCMADGEVVAYRICRDYLNVPWETGPLHLSGSFVLVRHFIQPGEKKENGLQFYTLYMHLAPYSAYASGENETQWIVNDNLSAYRPEWLLSACTDNKSVSDSYRAAIIPKGAHVEWDASDSSLHTIGSNGRRYGLVTFNGLSDRAKGKGTKTGLKEGQQYWILTDRNNLVPSSGAAARPSWWTHLLPPYAEPMAFDTVVCPTPYPIGAGDSIGHLGYFQVPKDGGYDSRYQVHIECLSADDSLPTFLTNPENAGENAPLYLKCPTGLPLFSKDLNTKTMVSDGKVTTGEALLKLSEVKTELDAEKQEYWFLPYANGYVPKSNTSVETLSQYDLEKLGFTTTVDEAPGFDHLDGKTPPEGLVRSIINRLLDASGADTRLTHRAVPHNYRRLLNRIDGSISPYSRQEYLSAVHNPSYRDVKNKMIVKHPSEWYHKKDDSIWLSFLNNLTKDAPEWKEYSEAYIEKMVWMQEAGKLKLGPSLWHMHPVEFLGCLSQSSDLINVDAFIALYEKEHVSFAPGTAALTSASKRNFRKLLANINEFYSSTQEYDPNLYKISYMLATARHETYHYTTAEFFSEKPEIGGVSYFNKYDPVLADTQKRRDRAVRNGNTAQGDGFKYRGRGCVHLTWKNNYKKAQNKFGVNFVGSPDLAGDFKYAVPIMIWGMEEGIFSGKALRNYIGESGVNYSGARYVINGQDQSTLIASYAKRFEDILEKTSTAQKGF